MHPLLVLIGLLVGAQVAGLWGALFGIPVLAVINVFVNYAVNLRTLEERSAAEVEEALEEVREEVPGASPEELVALAADRVEEDSEAEDLEHAAEAMDRTSEELRAAAGDLWAGTGERTGSGEPPDPSGGR